MDIEKRPTMADVAKSAGVSSSAVSLALRHHPSIPEATRTRIESIASQIGYRPNPMVSALMEEIRRRNNSTSMNVCALAFVDLHDTEHPSYRKILYDRYFQGARERGSQLGYNVEKFNLLEPGMAVQRLTHILKSRGIDGIILAPLPDTNETLEIDWGKFSVVSLSHTLTTPLSICTHHHYANMELALQKVHSMGYTQPGFCTSYVWDQRVRGLYSAAFLHSHFLKHSVSKPPSIFFFKQTDFTSRFQAWIKRIKPDVLISGAGPPIFEALDSLGLKVPDDIGFVTFSRWGDHAKSAGIDELPEDVGAMALDAVAAQLQRNERGLPPFQKIIMREGAWRDGTSVRDQKK